MCAQRNSSDRRKFAFESFPRVSEAQELRPGEGGCVGRGAESLAFQKKDKEVR